MSVKGKLEALKKLRSSTLCRMVLIETSIQQVKDSGIPHLMEKKWLEERAKYQADIDGLEELINELSK